MTELREETVPEEEYSPLDAGRDARLKGIHLIDNPWAINNWKHYEWEKGWKQADETAGGAAEPQTGQTG